MRIVNEITEREYRKPSTRIPRLQDFKSIRRRDGENDRAILSDFARTAHTQVDAARPPSICSNMVFSKAGFFTGLLR